MAEVTGADGTVLYWDEAGAGASDASPAVLLVHGITESHETWQPVIDRLRNTHRVVWLDLRGHGRSSPADRYDLEAMAGDVIAVSAAAGLDRPHLVGHSLGGAVVSAVGAALPVRSVTNVDQSLQLGAFKDLLAAVEDDLRNPDTSPLVIDGFFGQMFGDRLAAPERERLTRLRRPDQDVVLGAWEMIFALSADEIDAAVDAALAGYAERDVRYLSLFGIDPGPDYADWLMSPIAGAVVEVWAEHGHYPHLVDPDRFVARL
ncbi:MAG TPA: alpha/beta fold hydrolase, partial [Acidimicrobiia bacterium]|nr:alpha/beta fold hydrolase [Acidimicrobiia bacterium]